MARALCKAAGLDADKQVFTAPLAGYTTPFGRAWEPPLPEQVVPMWTLFVPQADRLLVISQQPAGGGNGQEPEPRT